MKLLPDALSNKIRHMSKSLAFQENQNIPLEMQRRALHHTVDYIEQQMPNVRQFSDKYVLLTHAIELAPKKGLLLEFGVFSGDTINHVAKLRPAQQVHGFDSFEGLPEFWREGFDQSHFKVAKLPKVRSNVELIKGWFDKSLPPFVKKHKHDCAFIHIDCDLYSSTKTVFKELEKKIVKGTVIVFDEYFNYPGWQQGEHKAFLELVKRRKLKFEYVGYNTLHEQVAVRIL